MLIVFSFNLILKKKNQADNLVIETFSTTKKSAYKQEVKKSLN